MAVKEKKTKKVAKDLKEKGSLGIKKTNKQIYIYVYINVFILNLELKTHLHQVVFFKIYLFFFFSLGDIYY